MESAQNVSEHLRLSMYGPNPIDVPVKPLYIILLQEVLRPFYIFQMFCTAVWLAEEYYYFAGQCARL